MNKDKTSELIFQNSFRDKDREQLLSIIDRDSSRSKLFSYESVVDRANRIDSHSCFPMDDEIRTNPMSSYDRQEIDLMQNQGCDLLLPIVTPPQPCTGLVEISVNPSLESELNPLLLQQVGDDSQSIPLEKEIGLLFPSIDLDSSTSTTLECRKPLCLEHNVNDFDSATNSDRLMTMSDLYETEVYRALLPSLPFPESFRPILSLLLHMEFSPITRGRIVKQACGIVNAQWKEGSQGKERKSEVKVKNIAGKIVDTFVEAFGHIVDLSVLFQASATTHSHVFSVEDDRLSIFFRDKVNVLKPAKIESQCNANWSTDPYYTNILDESKYVSRQKRKDRSINGTDGGNTTTKKRSKFEPTLLQLAVAYGATYSRNESLLDCGSLEEFIVKASSRLQRIDAIEQRHMWKEIEETFGVGYRNTSPIRE